jgi:hypothetical protein
MFLIRENSKEEEMKKKKMEKEKKIDTQVTFLNKII